MCTSDCVEACTCSRVDPRIDLVHKIDFKVKTKYFYSTVWS